MSKLSSDLKHIIEGLGFHVSNRKGCKSVTISHDLLIKKLEQLNEIRDKLINKGL